MEARVLTHGPDLRSAIGPLQLRTLQRMQGNQAVGRLLSRTAGRGIQRLAARDGPALDVLEAPAPARPSSFAVALDHAAGAGMGALSARARAAALSPAALPTGLEPGAPLPDPGLPNFPAVNVPLPEPAAADGAADPAQADRFAQVGAQALDELPLQPAPQALAPQLKTTGRPGELPRVALPEAPALGGARHPAQGDAEGLATLDLNMSAAVARDAGHAFAPARAADRQQAAASVAVGQEAQTGLAHIDAQTRAQQQAAGMQADRDVQLLHAGWTRERNATVATHKGWMHEQAGASGAEARQTLAEADGRARAHVEEAERAQPDGAERSSGWWDRIRSAGRAVAGAIRGVASSVIDFVAGLLAEARRRVAAIVSRLAQAIRERVDAVLRVVADASRRAWAAMAAVARRVQAFVDRLVAAAAEAARRLWAALRARLAAAWQALVRAVQAAFQAARNIANRIASAYLTLREILRILRSGALERLFDAARDPARLAQPIVDRAAPFVPLVPPKADQLAAEQGQAGATPATAAPGRTAAARAVIQRAPALQRSVGDQAAQLVLEGHTRQDAPEVAPAPPGEGFLGGVWRHMRAAGNHFLQNWATTLINLVYSLLTFYPVLLQEGPQLWAECKGVIFGGGGVDRFDHVLGVLRRLVNIVAGLVATTGIWALIIGAFTGPGEAVVVGAYESISLGVLAADVTLGLAEMGKAWYSATRDGISTRTRETYLSMFSGSVVSTAITIVLVVLGAIASRLAKAFKARRAAPAPEPEPTERPAAAEGEGRNPASTEPPRPGAPDKLVICRVCDIVPGVPADLMTKRAGLSAESRARLDHQAAKDIFTDPANPTPQQFDNLRAFIDAMERRGAGAANPLEQGLQDLMAADARRNAPPPSPPARSPFGARSADLPVLRAAVDAKIAEIEAFARARPDLPSSSKIADNLRSVANGPLADMESGVAESSPYLYERVQGSLRGAEGELDAARPAPSGTLFNEMLGGREFDQIRPNGTLMQIKRWDVFGVDEPRFANVEEQLRGSLEVAEQFPVSGQPRAVVIEFMNGVKSDVAARLRAVEVNGRRATIVGREVP